MNTNIVPYFSRFSFFTFFLFFLFLIIACTRNDAQRDFEKEAYSFPNNFTQTTAQGEVESTDEDDWRISPLFQGLIEINPPFPNPTTTNQAIQFEVEVTGIQSVSGIEVLVRFEDNSFRSVYQDFETLSPGLTTFQVNPIEFAQFGNPEGARGLSRLFIFDGRSQMISYGDVLVE
jgi:hypothetical protein